MTLKPLTSNQRSECSVKINDTRTQLKKEGGHYELSGSDTDLSVYHGNAVIVGNIVRLNLSLSGTDNTGEVWTGNMIGSLNPATLDGTWIFMGLWSDVGVPPTPERTTGSMIRIQCP